jgi:hypothetical protein
VSRDVDADGPWFRNNSEHWTDWGFPPRSPSPTATGATTMPSPEAVKATPSQRTTLARVAEGDRLMTILNGRTVGPYRFSDGEIRTVAEKITRKARPSEMPGTLTQLIFTDGTRTDERYGTTGHYRAEVFGL